MYDKVKKMLVRHEGNMCTIYTCKAGKISVGVGRNLTDNGISEDESDYMLENDIKRVYNNLDKHWAVWRSFPEEAQMVCIDLTFNLGINGFMNFRRTRALMEMEMWLQASEELLDSKYAIQLPVRSSYNSRQLALCTQHGKQNIGRSSK
jgi:lysozyme